MSAETENDLIHCFFISIIGFLIYYFLWHKVDLQQFGLFQYSLIPFIILIVTHFNRKTLMSFRFVKLCFFTWLYSTSIPPCIAFFAFMTGKLHC